MTLGTGSARSQEVVQALSVSLMGYDEVNGKALRITTPDLIRYFAQTNVPGGKLLLVTPSPNAPGTLDNLGVFLRVVKGNTILFDVPSPDTFNVYQDFAAVHTTGNRTTVRAINRFSFEYGNFSAELQGFATWTITQRSVNGVDLGGTGAFVASVNGAGTVDGVTSGAVPIHGTITAGAPRPSHEEAAE